MTFLIKPTELSKIINSPQQKKMATECHPLFKEITNYINEELKKRTEESNS